MKLVNEKLKQDSSYEFLESEEKIADRKKVLADQGYNIAPGVKSKGFTAKKENKRIVVRLQ